MMSHETPTDWAPRIEARSHRGSKLKCTSDYW